MIFNNIIPSIDSDKISSEIGGELFPWIWNGFTVEETENSNNFQFTHRLFGNNIVTSEYFYMLLPILTSFEQRYGSNIKNILRVKANLLTKGVYTDEDLSKSIHIDSYDDRHMSLIYYVIDSDGDTVILDDCGVICESVSPIKSNLCWFKSTTKHRATPPKLNKRRIVINFVVEV